MADDPNKNDITDTGGTGNGGERSPAAAQADLQEESFTLDDDADAASQASKVTDSIAREQSKTANYIAQWMVAAVLASLAVVFVLFAFVSGVSVFVGTIAKLFLGSTHSIEASVTFVQAVFDKWLAVVGPLLGTVIGFYFGRQMGGDKSARTGV
jgi:uncharacterized membrane protein YjjP (DUF1212 family)